MRTIRDSNGWHAGLLALAALAVGATAPSSVTAKGLAPVVPPAGVTITTKESEMPSWVIPNIGEAAES